MNIFIILSFLFFIGSLSGWVIELLFRRFISSSNPKRRWINPGFCTGPYLPLYGFGLCLLYLIASAEKYQSLPDPLWNKIFLFAGMAVSMTVIEYLAGIFTLKTTNVRLWDYSHEWGNIQGIVCPKFSAIWTLLGACYYFLIHPRILGALDWLSHNQTFSFVIGLFFGVFIIDVVRSTKLIVRLREYAYEHDVIVRYETIKADIRGRYDETKERYHFFFPFRSDQPLHEHLTQMLSSFEMHERNKKNNTASQAHKR